MSSVSIHSTVMHCVVRSYLVAHHANLRIFDEAFPGAAQLKLDKLMAAGNGIQYGLMQTKTSIAKCSDTSMPSEMHAVCQKCDLNLQWPPCMIDSLL